MYEYTNLRTVATATLSPRHSLEVSLLVSMSDITKKHSKENI
jgi:hypothetical protein